MFEKSETSERAIVTACMLVFDNSIILEEENERNSCKFSEMYSS